MSEPDTIVTGGALGVPEVHVGMVRLTRAPPAPQVTAYGDREHVLDRQDNAHV